MRDLTSKQITMRNFLKAYAPFLALLFISSVHPQTFSIRDNYTKQEHYITMRDGTRLFTSIYIPKDTSRPYPFLMVRTPYSCSPYGAEAFRNSLGPEPNFAREKFIFVYQDVRGRYMSEGDFKWMTPFIPNKKPGDVDESTDTWDTIEWLLKNIPNNNGKIGVYGTSFPGHYAAQCLFDPHPALSAASPQAPMADNWLGDDMHHNGAFFLPHAMNFRFRKKTRRTHTKLWAACISTRNTGWISFLFGNGSLKKCKRKISEKSNRIMERMDKSSGLR